MLIMHTNVTQCSNKVLKTICGRYILKIATKYTSEHEIESSLSLCDTHQQNKIYKGCVTTTDSDYLFMECYEHITIDHTDEKYN